MTTLKKTYSPVQFKEISEEGEIEGYASVFGLVDQGMDIVEKGAFKKSLRARTPKMLFQHDPSTPIGVWTDIKEDEKGLFVKGRLLEKVSKGAEVLELLRAKALDGLSIGYRTIRSKKDERESTRTLLELDLFEISLVTFPMLEAAKISGVKQEWTKRNVESILRDAGMPNAMAVKLISGGWDAANTKDAQRDAGSAEILPQLRQATELLKGTKG